jgi:hypothetical protein
MGLLAVAGDCMPAQPQVAVSNAWVRATVPGQRATGMFVSLTANEDATLVGADSGLAGRTEIHEMSIQDNVMRMRAVSRIALPAGRMVELRPGGYHVMLMELKRALKPGESVPVRLIVETAGGGQMSLQVTAPVKPLAYDGR